MVKILPLVLAMASGVLVEECSMADIPIETYDIKVVNGSGRPAIVDVLTADLESQFTLVDGEENHVGGFKLGDWKVTVITFAPTAQLEGLEAELAEKLRNDPWQLTRMTPAEVSQLQARLREVRQQIAAARHEVASCSGKFVWNKDDIHLRDTVTISRDGGVWKVTC